MGMILACGGGNFARFVLQCLCQQWNQNSFRADGKYSQITMVLPDQDSVVTLISECRRGEELMRALYDLVCAEL